MATYTEQQLMNATTWGRGGRAHPQTGQVAERVGEEPNQVQSASLSLAAVAVVPAPHLLQPQRATDKSGNQYADLLFKTSGTVHFHCPWLLFALPAAHLYRQPRVATSTHQLPFFLFTVTCTTP